MNWRALGCAVLAAAIFIGLGVWGLQMAMGRPGCPSSLQWGDRVYEAVGEPATSPEVGPGQPVLLGTTLVGALSRDVFGPEGSDPNASGEERPDVIALDCGNATFVTYELAEVIPTAESSP